MSTARDTTPSSAHREEVGGLFDEIGQHQFDYLCSEGLQPRHQLLDVGCGCLRAGVHFVRYLEPGHYHGIDRQQWLLDAAVEIELPRAGLAGHPVDLLCRDDFDVSKFGLRFDYALAQSVFTHLPWNSILRCLHQVARVLAPGGVFYATFFEDPDGSHWQGALEQRGGAVSWVDADPYHYAADVFEELACRVGLAWGYIGDWDHPRGQKMMCFRKPAAGG